MKFRILMILVVCSISSISSAEACLHYMGEPVTLSGKVTIRTFYGPPNYGENPDTDSRETQGILQLTKPICVNEYPSEYYDAIKNQFKVTLVPPVNTNLKNYRGTQVTVHGTLFHAFTGHHHTPVLMEVNSIEKTSE